MLFGADTPVTVDVNLDGEAYTVTMPRPNGPEACLWALTDAWWFLFPGALEEDQRAYWDERLADTDDPLERHMLRPIAFRLAQQIYGVPWWAAHRIAEEAAGSYLMWQAWCIKHAFQPATETPDRIIASMIGWASEHWEDAAQAQSWKNRTFMAPKNVRDEG